MTWRPQASLPTLRLRAELLAATRAFFAERGVLEVDTPSLVRHAVTDPQLHSAEVRLPGHPATLYLHTSPEYAMKRLLAAGSGDIYQIAHVYRGEEFSRLHNPEFTLVEWYRCGFSMPALMDEVAQLTQRLLGMSPALPLEHLSYSAALERATGCEPLGASDTRLRGVAIELGLELRLAAQCQRDELLDWLMASVVGPRLGEQALCFVHGYPASQASLARLDPDDARIARRFELYYRGVELANGFEELADAAEQRARFEADREQRRQRDLPLPEIDQALLQALESGLPPVAGVALGFDRLLMLRTGASEIASVLTFALPRA
ncbi:MAG TPA: EF-P lysine aminoacylase EpmA [Steroidobacteraceae bacterium]|jgi:lysyl-tRNA synthetase class 2